LIINYSIKNKGKVGEILLASLNNQLAKIQTRIQKQINDSLKKEVSTMVKNKISNHVALDVYVVYPNPIEYERRHFENGSLGDVKQMESTLIDDGVLKVQDNADFNHEFASMYDRGYGGVDLSKSLSENIEYGYGSMSRIWNKPRRFIKNTKEDIKDSNSHVETMKIALRKRLGNSAVK